MVNSIESTLSPRHHEFLDGLLTGEGVIKAAKKAGFTTPSRDAVPILMDTRTQKYLINRMRAGLFAEACPQAWQWIAKWMNDEKLPVKLRFQCAKHITEVCGFIPPKAAASEQKNDTDVKTMAPDQLRAFIAQAEAELAGMATLINPPAQSTTQSNTLSNLL